MRTPSITILQPLSRGQRREMLELLRLLERDSRLPGQACGIPGGPRALWIMEALLLDLYPVAGGLWTPSLPEIAASSGCSVSTVSRLLPWLRECGFVHYEARYRLEPAAGGSGLRPRRATSAFWIPPLADFRAAYECQKRTASLQGQNLTIYGIRPRPWRILVDNYAAPDAPPVEEEIEHRLEAGTPPPSLERQRELGLAPASTSALYGDPPALSPLADVSLEAADRPPALNPRPLLPDSPGPGAARRLEAEAGGGSRLPGWIQTGSRPAAFVPGQALGHPDGRKEARPPFPSLGAWRRS